MRDSKFSLNAFLLVVLIVAALTFFITVKVVDLADRSGLNTFTPIEGTDVAVHYSSLEPNGLYRGTENVHTLLLEGNFGTDWGAAAAGDRLYLNSYDSTDLGVVLCDVVTVDLNTMQKTVLLKNAVLRGRCASGELVCMSGEMLEANTPSENALVMLYAISDATLEPDGTTVAFLDPETGKVVYETADTTDSDEAFEAQYLARTLEEVRK